MPVRPRSPVSAARSGSPRRARPGAVSATDRRRSPVVRSGPVGIAAILVAVGLSGPPSPASASFRVPTSPPEGWDAKVQFGAEATAGASRTSSLSFESTLSWHVGRFETAARARLLRSNASVEVEREIDGEPVLGPDGEPVTEIVSDRTNERIALALQPRYYLVGERRYLFGLLDYDTNPPAGVERSTRQVLGVGYRLWNDKRNYLAAGVGVGNKSLEKTDGEGSDGGIGYFGIQLALAITERAALDAALDTDFGGDDNFTEFGIAIGYQLAEPVSIKLGYDARVNGGVDDESSAFDERLDARASLKLEVDLL